MSAADPDALFEVRMLGLPLVLRERSRQQGADLLREMTLVRGGQDEPAQGQAARAHVPARLLELAHELDTVYAPYAQAGNEELDAALDRGEEVFPTVVYRIPRSATAFLHHVRQVLAEAEEFCRSDGYLLTLAPTADIVAYREWSIEEVLRQADGHEPRPWAEYATAQGLAT